MDLGLACWRTGDVLLQLLLVAKAEVKGKVKGGQEGNGAGTGRGGEVKQREAQEVEEAEVWRKRRGEEGGGRGGG